MRAGDVRAGGACLPAAGMGAMAGGAAAIVVHTTGGGRTHLQAAWYLAGCGKRLPADRQQKDEEQAKRAHSPMIHPALVHVRTVARCVARRSTLSKRIMAAPKDCHCVVRNATRSELIIDRELRLALWRPGAGDLPEGGVGDVAVRVVVAGQVEGIEHVCAELHRL